MVTKESKPKATEKKTAPKKAETKAPAVKVTRSTPIKVIKRDRPAREQGLEILARFYMGEMDVEMMKRRALKFEGRKIGDEEAIMALLDDMIRNSDHPQIKARCMEAIAEFQSIMGQDPRRVLAEMHKMELSIFKDLGFESVSISCKDGACAACKRQDGAKLTIEQALEMMPLPHVACTKRAHSKAAPFCRCKYFGEYTG